MTTPTMDLYLPKTYVFKRISGVAYATRSPMARVDAGGMQFVYLPRGLSQVTVISTGMEAATLELTLNQGDKETSLSRVVGISEPTLRVWAGQISNRGTNFADGGVYLRIYAERVTTQAMNSGSVSVQVVNFPPET